MNYELRKKCQECPTVFAANSNVQRFCKPCKTKRRAERSRDHNRTYYLKHSGPKYEATRAYNKSEKGRAAQKVRDAVRQGKLTRLPCEVCGEKKTDGHHDDYSKPLEVRWLCKTHHAQEHLYEDWQRPLVRAGYKGGFLLGELIEACGKDFGQLSPWREGEDGPITRWSAVKFAAECGIAECCPDSAGDGNTPEEAVAMLYLALNKKQT